MRKVSVLFLFVITALFSREGIELDVVCFEDLINREEKAVRIIQKALLEKGIVGISEVPTYKEKRKKFMQAERAFHALAEEVKRKYSPDRASGDILGYECGIEKFQREDGTWMVDESKVSFYARVPDQPKNKWPKEVDLQTPYLDMTNLMVETGKLLLDTMGLHHIDAINPLGRMLYYKAGGNKQNSQWCGAHFDHSMITALLPASYFYDGEKIEEPEGAGLYVRLCKGKPYQKVLIPSKDIILFQVGECAQLLSNDKMVATEHFVQKAKRDVERMTLAVFIEPIGEQKLISHSRLTSDSRYKAPFTYEEWAKNTYDRYLVKQK